MPMHIVQAPRIHDLYSMKGIPTGCQPVSPCIGESSTCCPAVYVQRERYFAQPPLELLRQWFDHGGWYERKPPCAFRALIDTQLVAAMGPPGGGRNPVTARLLRHFHNLSFTELSDDSLKRIFGTILEAFFTRKGFNPAVLGATQQLVASTVQLYNSIREEMLPTPAKSHYTFNLRDLSKVVQGLMRAEPSTCPDVKQVGAAA